jgi:hypothetical protein
VTRFFAPEVVQTSAMDCGPAALTCLLEGFGIGASYGRLREACQTDVDGTSIDTLEEIAVRLGLDAEQIMVPVDHVLLTEAAVLPAIVVIRLPNGFTHFVVVWRRHGPFVQIMDPASGRRYWTSEDLLSRLYVHETDVPVESFQEWVESEDFMRPLRRRMRDVGVGASSLLEDEKAKGWRAIARLDAGTRMVASLVSNGALRRGAEAAKFLRAALDDPDAIPESYFTGRVVAGADGAGLEEVRLRGAVLVRIGGSSAA